MQKSNKNKTIRRKFPSYNEYLEKVVQKCGHKYIILDHKDFRSYRIAAFSNPGSEGSLPKGKLIKITPAKCKSYSCPICGKKKVLDLVNRLKNVDLKNYRFFTLTLKNKFNLDDTETNLNRISDSFNKLNKALKKKGSFKDLQYFRVTEIGKDGMVHIHGIWNKYVPSAMLSVIWNRITKDSYIVKVERIKNKKDAIEYLYKYLTKDVAKGDQTAAAAPTLINLDPTNTARLFYENNKRRYNSSRNFFPKESKTDKEYLPYYYENSTSEEVENVIMQLIKNYNLTYNHFDFTYYCESDQFIYETFFNNKGSPKVA